MDSSDHPLQFKKKPIDEIFILVKDLRSDIAQIRRDMVLIKNEIQKINKEEKEVSSGGWLFS